MSGEEIKTLYYVIGFMVVTNLGALGSFLGFGFKIVFNYATLIAKVNALHERLDKLEGGDRDERKRR